MSSDLRSITTPEEYKKLIKKKWKIFTETEDYADIMKTISFEKYKIEIAEHQHKQDVIELVNDSYNKHSWWFSLFGGSAELDRSEQVCQQIDNGRMFIIKDENNENEIIACFSVDDIMDHMDFSEGASLSKPMQHVTEIAVHINTDLNDYVYQQIGGKDNLTYGMCSYGGTACIKNKIKRKLGFTFVFQLIALCFFFVFIGYTMSVTVAAHPSTERTSKKQKATIIKTYDFSNYVFKDGTNIMFISKNFNQKIHWLISKNSRKNAYPHLFLWGRKFKEKK
eukprot:240977_1